jgi:hypothetical protein
MEGMIGFGGRRGREMQAMQRSPKYGTEQGGGLFYGNSIDLSARPLRGRKLWDGTQRGKISISLMGMPLG